MKLAIVTLTKGAAELGRTLCDKIGGTLYTKSKWSRNQDQLIEKPFGAFAGKLFESYDGIVFIMATGIVVRSIAPYIKDKTSDPAIVVMDEMGTHAISLLSGHLGGANALTHKVAQTVGATPVITTASDVQGRLAVDMFAKRLGAEISSMEAAKDVTAVGVDGGVIHVFYHPKRIGIQNDMLTQGLKLIPVDGPMQLEVKKFEAQASAKDVGAIFISADHLVLPKNTVQLIPTSLTVGIGCRRGVRAEVILEVFSAACRRAHVSSRAVKKLATIELKSKEEGIIALSHQLDIPLEIVELDKIKAVQAQFAGSDFVEKTIGVRAVAEPCAMLASNKGYMRLYRYADQGVTIAIWEEEHAK